MTNSLRGLPQASPEAAPVGENAVPERIARIALVGPIRPYRGGIAQHTTLLAHALGERTELLVVSFRRQYPKWLFPGESDREPGAGAEELPDVRFIIDSLNPLTWYRALRAIVAFRPDLVVIPWWTVFWGPCFGALARGSRRRGIPVRFLCHNVYDHERTWWKSVLTRYVLRYGSSFVVHSSDCAEQLRLMLGEPVVIRCPHPVYRQFPAPREELPRRAPLELLFFGLVRPYKGLDVLIEALGRLEKANYFQTIAGEFWIDRGPIDARIATLGIQDNVEIVARYISDEEAAALFARADVVVLPYRHATGSGVTALAYHYGKPVIASAVGGLPDVIREGETGLLVPPGDAAALARAIASMSATRAAAMAPAIAALTREMTWERLAVTLTGQIEKNNV